MQNALLLLPKASSFGWQVASINPAYRGSQSFFPYPSGVQVYKDYQGSGTTPDQRMDVANPDLPSSTTLSGDIDQDNQLDEDNTDYVVVFTHAHEQTRLDGVVITGGYASQTNTPL